jgi:RNA binding exosome subunit
VQGEVRSVEISLLLHATENDVEVEAAVTKLLRASVTPDRDELEGAFGNRILRLTWHMEGGEAWGCFGAIMELLGENGRRELQGEMKSLTDERGSLYLRLSKQSLMKGEGRLSTEDPLRVKVRPSEQVLRGDHSSVYSRLIRRWS